MPHSTSSTPYVTNRFEAGASESKVATGTPLFTAELIASVSLFASEQLTEMPSAPASTSCSIASACFWASSSLGVRQSILIFILYFALSSLAASWAPTRAAWKTGLPWDLATRPMVMVRGAACASTAPASPATRRDRIFFMGNGCWKKLKKLTTDFTDGH